MPSRVHPGNFYALPQSPQLFKQLLMASGYDRYFQIARCFRDEDLRADRQPEFTQADMELSFVDIDDVIDVNERLLKFVFKEAIGVDVQIPLQRMPWQEAMDRFGSDKPDTRFGMELVDVSETVKGCGFGVFTGALETVVLSVVSMSRDRDICRVRRLTSWWSMQRAAVPRDLLICALTKMALTSLLSQSL